MPPLPSTSPELLLSGSNRLPYASATQITMILVERRHHSLQMKIADQPDLAPSDFHPFGPRKQHLGGKHFADDDDVQHEVLL
ncbi:hypothetical protein AVEN_112336-1 [Araneus ventricosus]|uniref:Uncharacterized protein n=1 Tax=Araneus ventricosus TaxID=182803 RepID=A0A4Y2NNU6_ARAVE|nr:hypothetical protein AVEN_112336-1 [Araneus ventricosus]